MARNKSRALLRVVCFTLLLLVFGTFYHDLSWIIESCYSFRQEDDLKYVNKDSLFLSERQCRAAYPDLAYEVDRAVAKGHFKLEIKPDDTSGLIQVRIKDGKLYIISVDPHPTRDKLAERTALLSQLHRALLTSPHPLPNTILTLSLLDNPMANTISFSRPISPGPDPSSYSNDFLMPHFSFWSWSRPFIGSLSSALSTISTLERITPFPSKIPRAVWRGTAFFNPITNLNLRGKLLEVSYGKKWADIEELRWGVNGEDAENAIPIAGFCRYKYIIYTEGITYSGRLPVHQACTSIILTPPLNYLMHTTHLMRPLSSSSLFLDPLPNINTPSLHPSWPVSYAPTEANIIFVSPDWSDLEPTITWLEAHPELAERIVKNQRETNVKTGYLSESAEVCYWRSLIRGWSSVVEPVMGSWGNDSDGVRWEDFSLTGRVK